MSMDETIIMQYRRGERNMKKIVVSLLFLIIISGLMSGCVEEETKDDTLSILVTIVPQVEMVEAIGGDLVDVTVMVPTGESPHSFEPTPDQMIQISQATAYFKVGSGVEFELTYMNTILEQNPELIVYDCSEEIDIKSFDEHYGKEYFEEEKSDSEDDGHDHDGTDPHIWTSPVNFKKMATVVYEGLIEIDPDHEQDYSEQYQNYIDELDLLHQNISDMLAEYEGKSFMVYHPAWGYFGDTYNLKMIAIEDEGKQPGPAGIAAIIDQAQNESISVIFVSPQFDTSSAEAIASEINGNVVSVDPLTADYTTTIRTLAETLVKGYSK